jgi:hypothetical protein
MTCSGKTLPHRGTLRHFPYGGQHLIATAVAPGVARVLL